MPPEQQQGQEAQQGSNEQRKSLPTPAEVAFRAYGERLGAVGKEAVDAAFATFSACGDHEIMFTLCRLSYLNILEVATLRVALMQLADEAREERAAMRKLLQAAGVDLPAEAGAAAPPTAEAAAAAARAASAARAAAATSGGAPPAGGDGQASRGGNGADAKGLVVDATAIESTRERAPAG